MGLHRFAINDSDITPRRCFPAGVPWLASGNTAAFPPWIRAPFTHF